MIQITAIATLVNEFAITDLKVLLFTLQLWNSPAPTVYIFSDTKSAPLIKAIQYSGKIILKEGALNAYTGLNRRAMESRRGRIFNTLFADFTAEKTKLMEWALETEPAGVLFCDADICHLAPLPTLPDDTGLALSPHMIRKSDTDRYGIYNAGYLWFKNPELARKWQELCKTSRFFEQGCLEDLAVDLSLYEFPIQVNYGWWRLWQGVKLPVTLQMDWGLFRKGEETSGITVEKLPLQSIHTHWAEKSDRATYEFNTWVLSQLARLSSVKKTAALVNFLSKI
jgi:hypothetical protein